MFSRLCAPVCWSIAALASLSISSCDGRKWREPVEKDGYFIVSQKGGATEPSGLLPIQLPADMKTVELQKEDVPFDLECYVDEDGNIYDFAFGMNWDGIIKDKRVSLYTKKH